MPLVSVIIATRDRSAVLMQCLQHIVEQDYAHYEIVVVDNSVEQQKTMDVVRCFDDLIYLRADPQKRNPAAMRNTGIQASRGDILAFIDDDTLVTPGWFEALVQAFHSPEVGGVVGRVIEADAPEVNTAEVGRFSPRGEITMNFNNLIGHPVEVEFLYGCNMALRRSAMRSVGLYDPWSGFAYEEQDIGFRVRRGGWKLLYVPGMTGTHLKAPRPQGVSRRSDSFDVPSVFRSCRSLAFLCVAHFGVRTDFARVALVNIPKGMTRSFIDAPSSSNFLKIPAAVLGATLGYGMAVAVRLGLHRAPCLA